MSMATRVVAIGVAVIAFAVPSSVAFAHAGASKTKVGQTCNPKVKAPTGFKCVKGKNGKYTYQK
jgi:hypothetical protein